MRRSTRPIPADDEQKIGVLVCEFGDRPAASLTQQELAVFLESRQTSPATFNRYRATLSMIYREAIRNGWTEKNPARLIRAKKEGSGRIRFLADEEEMELRKVIAAEYSERNLNEFEVAVHTGMRRRNNSLSTGFRPISGPNASICSGQRTAQIGPYRSIPSRSRRSSANMRSPESRNGYL